MFHLLKREYCFDPGGTTRYILMGPLQDAMKTLRMICVRVLER